MHAIEAREHQTALGGALFLHGLLAASLFVSWGWSPKAPPVVQVELWSSPPADRPNPAAAPVPTPPPKPTPAPAPPPPAPKAEIALQKPPEPPKRDLQEEARREAAKKEAQRKAAAEQAAQKKLAEQKAAQRREANRQAELARLLGNDTKARPADQGKDVATKAGASQGAEIGAKTGVDADYIARIQARIRARITFSDRIAGNPEAIVIVEQLPSGDVVKVQLRKSSGIVAWDDAVQRAILLASPLPKKEDGTVVRTLELRFRPREES